MRDLASRRIPVGLCRNAVLKAFLVEGNARMTGFESEFTFADCNREIRLSKLSTRQPESEIRVISFQTF